MLSQVIYFQYISNYQLLQSKIDWKYALVNLCWEQTCTWLVVITSRRSQWQVTMGNIDTRLFYTIFKGRLIHLKIIWWTICELLESLRYICCLLNLSFATSEYFIIISPHRFPNIRNTMWNFSEMENDGRSSRASCANLSQLY